MMEDAGYSSEKMEEFRQRRRRLQNRQSARISAERRQSKYDAIAQANEALQSQIEELRAHNAELVRQTEEARQLALRAAVENHALQQEIAAMSSDSLDVSLEVPLSPGVCVAPSQHDGAEVSGVDSCNMDSLFPWGHGLFDAVQVL